MSRMSVEDCNYLAGIQPIPVSWGKNRRGHLDNKQTVANMLKKKKKHYLKTFVSGII